MTHLIWVHPPTIVYQQFKMKLNEVGDRQSVTFSEAHFLHKMLGSYSLCPKVEIVLASREVNFF